MLMGIGISRTPANGDLNSIMARITRCMLGIFAHSSLATFLGNLRIDY